MAHQAHLDVARRKRRLRLQIARDRRAIERHARRLSRETGRLMSWRTPVRALPLTALGAAFGVGFLLSAGLGRRAGSAVARAALSTFWRRTLTVGLATALRAWFEASKQRSDAGNEPDKASAPTTGHRRAAEEARDRKPGQSNSPADQGPTP